MIRTVSVVVIVLVVLAAGALFFLSKGPDLSVYEPLKEPRITTMKNRNMLVVEAKGDPNVVGSAAFKLLFKTYYKIKGIPRALRLPAPRARWAGDFNVKAELTGYYALPVPDRVTSLPGMDAEPGYQVTLTTWDYGTVVEVLHIGPYGEEEPTVRRIMDFVKAKGYEVMGLHEEEYIKGPGMFFKGDPNKYYTIIRYRVKKRGGA